MYIILIAGAISIVAGSGPTLSCLRIGSVARDKALVGAVLPGLSLAIGAMAIPALCNALGLVSLSLGQWVPIFALPFGLLIVVKVGKYVNTWRGRSRAEPKADE